MSKEWTTPSLQVHDDGGVHALPLWEPAKHGFLAMHVVGEAVPPVVACLCRSKGALTLRDRKRFCQWLGNKEHNGNLEVDIVRSALSRNSKDCIEGWVRKCQAVVAAIEERRAKQREAREKKKREGQSDEVEEEDDGEFENLFEEDESDNDMNSLNEELTLAVLGQLDSSEIEPKIAGEYVEKEKSRKIEAIVARWREKRGDAKPRQETQKPEAASAKEETSDNTAKDEMHNGQVSSSEDAACWNARSGTPWLRHYVPPRVPGMSGLCTLDLVLRDPSYSAKYGSRLSLEDTPAEKLRGLHRDIKQASKTKFFKGSEHAAFREVLQWLWDKHCFVMESLGHENNSKKIISIYKSRKRGPLSSAEVLVYQFCLFHFNSVSFDSFQ